MRGPPPPSVRNWSEDNRHPFARALDNKKGGGGIMIWVIGLSILLAVAPLTGVMAQAPQIPPAPQIPQVPGNLSIGAPAVPVITSPKRGDSVHSPIVVKGTAVKDAKVKV